MGRSDKFGKMGFVDTGPPPNMRQRELIFDSLLKIVNKHPKKGGRQGSDGRGTYVSTWGAGYSGQLGGKFNRGQKKYSDVPMMIELEAVVRQIECGGLHTAAVTEAGDVYTWGDDSKGQLGHTADPSLERVPRYVGGLEAYFIVQVACGGNHTLALDDRGNVFSWGWSKYGQTGHNETRPCPHPRKIAAEGCRDIIMIGAGAKHSMGINKKGQVFSWGCGEHGQTGQSDSVDKLVPTVIKTLLARSPDEEGKKGSSGRTESIVVRYIACGSIHSCLITDDGKLFLCGFGEYFHPNESQHFFYDPEQIELPEPVAQVACGQSHNIALSVTGNVYTWGSGEYGQLGYGIRGNLAVPRLVLDGKDIAQVAAGRYHSFALSCAGILYSWGCGENGQLGLGSDENIHLPTVVNPILGSVVGQVSCGDHHTGVITSAPWTRVSRNVAEWSLEAKTENEKKVEYLKNNHRGLVKADLQKIKGEMKKWRQMHEKKQEQAAKNEEEELKKEMATIAYREKLEEEIAKTNLGKSEKEFSLPAVSSTADDDDEEEEKPVVQVKDHGSSTVRLPKVSKKHGATEKKARKVTSAAATPRRASEPDETQRINALIAPTTRTNFLKETNIMIDQMTAVVSENGKEGSQKELQRMIRLCFAFRKEYDALRHSNNKKQEIVTRMKKESDLIKHHSGLADSNLAVFNERLNDLEMQLNTVTIKIAETSENRHNYELNITHLKEEDFDNFNKLEALRKQNQENNSFFKKMSELKIQAIDDKERAESELAEFRKEIGNYQDFVGNQLSQFQVILDIVRQQNDKREKAKITKSEALREKINRRIVTLEEEAQAAEKEAGGLTSRLTSLDLKLRHFEDSFQKITAATGLTNPESIVNKYFFKTEIRDQLQAEIEDKQSACAKLVEEKAALEDELAKAKAEFKEDTWADVEKLLEGGREADFRAAKGQGTNDSSAMTLAFAQEGLMSLLKNCCEVQESELEADVEAATGQLWSAELSSVVFTRMHESLDMLLETEQEYVQMHEAELARKKEEVRCSLLLVRCC
mmetsp:Transcript_3240/g.6107  ORF Transcript_3240/g.6107 Transcript_3240/m.6107 type:complete len:1040 (-) Transcript_3240:449-3568(-)